MPANFPQTRPDGSFAVAAMISTTGPDATDRVTDYVRAWPERYAATHQIDPSEVLSALSTVSGAAAGSNVFDIVLEGCKGSPRWKDLMIDLVEHLPTDANISFLGFRDLVSGEVHHPGSIP